MVYLIAEMTVYLLLAALLGVVLGYLLWGLAAKRRKQEIASLNESLAARQSSLDSLNADLDKAKASQTQAAADTNGLQERIRDLEAELAEHRIAAEELRASLASKDSEIIGHLQMHAERDRQLELLRAAAVKKDAV